MTLATACLLAFVASGEAYADDADGLRVGLALTQSNNDELDEDSAATGFDFWLEKSFSRYFGVAARYHDFGDESNSYNSGTGKETITINGYSIEGLGFLPISESASLFAKLGVLNWKAKYKDVRYSRSYVNLSDSGTDLYLGIGLDVRYGQRFGARFGYDAMTLNSETVDDSVGLSHIYLGAYMQF